MDRSRALTRKSRLGDDDEAFERELRGRTSAAERFAETWRLSEEIWRFKGWSPDAPGLSRSVTRVVRR